MKTHIYGMVCICIIYWSTMLELCLKDEEDVGSANKAKSKLHNTMHIIKVSAKILNWCNLLWVQQDISSIHVYIYKQTIQRKL